MNFASLRLRRVYGLFRQKRSLFLAQSPEPLNEFGDYSVILPEEPFVFGTKHILPRKVPNHITRTPYARLNAPEEPLGNDLDEGLIDLHGKKIERLRAAARLARDIKLYAGMLAKPGVTTDAIDEAVHEAILKAGAYPSPLHYQGYPRSCCTSVNNVIAHGIPDDRPLEDGDIVNVDVTVYLDGFHGDTSDTFLVGEVDAPGRALVETTNEALKAGIEACGPGKPFAGIARAIHKLLQSKPSSYSVSSQFTGHGIGEIFHRSPWIIHSLNDEPGVMVPGQCFTIEPCIIQGSDPRGWIFPDGWTASTENCARSAQAEHMVLITEQGLEVLTQ